MTSQFSYLFGRHDWLIQCSFFRPLARCVIAESPSRRVLTGMDLKLRHALEAGWQGLDIAETFSLDQIAQAHEFVERPSKPGRVIVAI